MTQETIDKLDLSSTIDPETLRDNANSIDDHIKAIEILSDNLTAEDLDLKVLYLLKLYK